jgi:LAO/AO transport system kinase
VAKVFHHHGQEMVTQGSEPENAAMWVPPILRTIAMDGTGVAELATAIGKHAEHLHSSGEWGRRERARLEAELEGMLTETLVKRFREGVPDTRYEKMVDRLVQRKVSPWGAVKVLLR